ncbi:MAG: short-chain dehydrogenase/reductase [Hyphomicrobiaceae bacterium]
MDLGLAGKLALVTGASKGIGRAVAEVLAEEGCHVALVARDAERLEQVAADLRARHNVLISTTAADLSLQADQDRLARDWGHADILVNNAGSNPPGEIDEVDEDVWRRSWDLKVFGYINMTRSFYKAMKSRGSGVIVNIIGNSGERMQSRYILGSSGNSALMSLTRALGARSPDHGIRVLAVNPGLTATDRAMFMLEGWSRNAYGTPDRWQDFIEKLDLPFGRMGEAREVADVVVFAVSQRASYVSGTVITVDGGAANRNA